MMTDLEELERLHAAASAGRGDHAQGPWDAGSTYPGTHARGGTVTFVSTSNTRPVAGITVICESQFPADAIAIAATHNAIPWLIAELRAARAGDAWVDAALPEDDAIKAAHPSRTGDHGSYAEALRLVGARRSKQGLVELVNWLLVERRRALAGLDGGR